MLRSRALPFTLFAVLAACSAASSDDGATSTGTDPIQAGQPDSGHPAVGLVWFQGGGFCTGTLIAPQVVLTAGHCVQDPIDGFYTGKGTATTNLSAPAAGLVQHVADKWIAHPSYSGSGGCPNTTFDIGLIHLSQPVSGITPMDIANGAAPTPQTTCDAVGYGTHTENNTDTYQQKRTGTEIVQSVAGTSIEVKLGTGLADHGDSGGPLICNGVIAGTTSCHTDGNWPQHTLEHYARVDPAASWIEQQIADWGGTVTDAGTDAGDNDASVTDAGDNDAGVLDSGPHDAGHTDAGHACVHALCSTGTKLTKSCDSCAASICAVDPYCCKTAWDKYCVAEVNSVCHQTCN